MLIDIVVPLVDLECQKWNADIVEEFKNTELKPRQIQV